MLFERLADGLDDLLDVGVADVHADDHAPLGGIAVNLQRAVHQVDGGHLAHRNLNPLGGADEEPVEVQVGHLALVEAYDQVEAALVLEDRTGRLAGVGRADDAVELLDVDAVAGNLGTVVLHYELRQTHRLLDQHV